MRAVEDVAAELHRLKGSVLKPCSATGPSRERIVMRPMLGDQVGTTRPARDRTMAAFPHVLHRV